ncbi:hypothetical protein ACLOJK_012568 [Asimina triloba]
MIRYGTMYISRVRLDAVICGICGWRNRLHIFSLFCALTVSVSVSLQTCVCTGGVTVSMRGRFRNAHRIASRVLTYMPQHEPCASVFLAAALTLAACPYQAAWHGMKNWHLGTVDHVGQSTGWAGTTQQHAFDFLKDEWIGHKLHSVAVAPGKSRDGRKINLVAAWRHAGPAYRFRKPEHK